MRWVRRIAIDGARRRDATPGEYLRVAPVICVFGLLSVSPQSLQTTPLHPDGVRSLANRDYSV